MRRACRAVCASIGRASSTHGPALPDAAPLTPTADVTPSPPVATPRTGPETVVTLHRLVDWAGAHEATRRLAHSLAGRHQVQRILRRLPLGRTDTDLYFNELPGNLKVDMVKAAYYDDRRRRAARGSRQGRASRTPPSTEEETAAPHSHPGLVTLPGPRVTIARDKIADHRRHVLKRSGTAALAASATTQDLCTSEATLALPVLAHRRASVGLAWRAPLVGDGGGGSVMVTTLNTAPRTQYATVPLIYLLGIPEPLMCAVEGEGARRAEEWLRELLLFDEVSQELLLRIPPATTTPSPVTAPATDADGLQPECLTRHIFLVQTFRFNPHDVHRAVQCGEARGRYRLLFLTSASRSSDIDTTTWQLLKGSGALFPSVFTSYHIDVDAYTPQETHAPSLLKAPLATPWTPLRMKRLRKDGDGTEPDLWSSQVAGGRTSHVLPTNGANASAAPSSSSSSLSPSPRSAKHGSLSTGASSAASSSGSAAFVAAERLHEIRRVFAEHQLNLIQQVAPHADSEADSGGLTATHQPSVSSEAGAQTSGARHMRTSFVVSEYRSPPAFAPASLPSRAEDGATLDKAALWLPRALHAALFHHRVTPLPPLAVHAPSTYTGTSLSCAPANLSTATADLMLARERVLLPFLRVPRRLWRSANADGHGPESPWLWSVDELAALCEWRPRFSRPYGPFHNLLAPELAVRLGARRGTTTTNRAKVDSALVLLHDRQFIEDVLLPAMDAYATAHYDIDCRRGLLVARRSDARAVSTAQPWGELPTRVSPDDVLALLDAQPDLAAAVQYKRLCAWSGALFQETPAQQRAWLHMDSAAQGGDGGPRLAGTGDTDRDDESFSENDDGEEVGSAAIPNNGTSRPKPPAAIRPFLRRAHTLACAHVAAAESRAAEEVTTAMTVMNVLRVIPIAPFLRWLAQRHGAMMDFSTEDEQRVRSYFASWREHFTLAGGVTSSVAFCASLPSAPRSTG